MERPGSLTVVTALGFAGIAAILFAQGRPAAATVSGLGSVTPDSIESLVGAVERTERSVERLARALEEAPGSGLAEPAARRTPARGASLDPASVASLTTSLDRLAETLERETRRTHELLRGAPALGGETLLEARRRNTTVQWGSLETLEADWRADRAAADRSQYLQTAKDLLEQYGPPTSIYRPKGGLLFVYRRHAEGQAGVAWYFRLQDGFVVEFWIQDETSSAD